MTHYFFLYSTDVRFEFLIFCLIFCSDLQNICLTGKRTESGDRKTISMNNGAKLSKEGLPFIVTSSNGKKVSQKPECKKQSITVEEERTDVRNNREDLIRTAPELTEDSVLPSVPSKPDLPHHEQDELVFFNSGGFQSKSETKRIEKERIRLPKFQWSECHVKKVPRGSNIATAKVPEKNQRNPVVENFHSSDSDESFNRPLVSRGNLRLGSTVQSPKLKSKPARVAVGKCEVFSSEPPSTAERARKSYQGGIKLPSETAFIQILGQQTGPPPKAANQNRSKEINKRRPRTEEKTFVNQNMPLQYLTRFGRRSFHHVLEARSFKPG